MSKDPKDARDRGFADGVAAKNEDGGFVERLGEALNPFSNPYRGDSDYPESYREGFKEGKK